MTEWAREGRSRGCTQSSPWLLLAIAIVFLMAGCTQASPLDPSLPRGDSPGGLGRPGCSMTPGRPLGDPGPSEEVELLKEGGGDTPRVEAVVYPHPSYEAKLWSQWGQGLVLPDGRFLSAIGDHLGPDGNSYLYEYDPAQGQLTLLADVLSRVEHQPGAWGYGKIHGEMVPGPCGEVYFATYWGDRDELVFSPSYQGDLLFGLDPRGRTLANLGAPVPYHGVPSLAGWPEGGLLYGESPDPTVEGNQGPFFVYDVRAREVLFTDDDPAHTGFRSIAVDARGRAYYSIGAGRLSVYDPRTNEVSTHPARLPGDTLRAASRVGPDGILYGVTEDPRVLFAMDPDGDIRTMGPVQDYTTSIALHPDGGRLYYVPGAHGSTWEYGAPLIELNTDTGEERVVVELNDLTERALGLRLGGTYNVAVDPTGSTVYIGMNAGTVDSEEVFGEVVLLIIHLP
jgi:hypothetical protein